jgi:hypothetical protein
MDMAAKKYESINALNEEATLMDYERGLAEIMQELGREIAESNLGNNSKDRRKKRNITPPSAPLQ